MRKLILFNMMTVDGYFEGENKTIDWHHVDEEFNEFAIEQLDNADLLIFGRITYQLMASYWPTDMAKTDDQMVSARMNHLSKIVFSRTLEKAEWENTRLIKEDAEQEIIRLKNLPGKDILILGSADLASSIMDLTDEIRVIINPVIIGRGKSLFGNVSRNRRLKLIKSRKFNSGNVLLYYENLKD